MRELMLDVRNLHAWYGQSQVLHGVDITINRGELVTLLGRNGAGKSTTLKSVLGKKIDVIFADHLNKPDIGAAKAREWFDTGGVDLINDLANSGVARAVAAVAKEKKRHIIVNGASNMGITNELCSPYAIHYAYDAYSLAHGTGKAVVEAGGKT